MQRFYAATQDRRVGSDALDGLAFIAQWLDKALCSARRNELHTFFMQLGKQLLQAIFVEDGDESSLDFFYFSHDDFEKYELFARKVTKICW